MQEKEIYRQAVTAPAGPMLTAEKPFLTVSEAAAYLGLSKRYLYNLTSARQIPHKKVGPRAVRFDRDALADWQRARTTDVPTQAEQAARAEGYAAAKLLQK